MRFLIPPINFWRKKLFWDIQYKPFIQTLKHMIKKRNLFKHVSKRKHLFFCKYLSIRHSSPAAQLRGWKTAILKRNYLRHIFSILADFSVSNERWFWEKIEELHFQNEQVRKLISVVKVYIQIAPKIKYFGDNLKFYQPAETSGQGSLIFVFELIQCLEKRHVIHSE